MKSTFFEISVLRDYDTEFLYRSFLTFFTTRKSSFVIQAIIIAALLSTENIFIFPANRREGNFSIFCFSTIFWCSEAKVVHQKFHAAEGDFTTMLNVFKVRLFRNQIQAPKWLAFEAFRRLSSIKT